MGRPVAPCLAWRRRTLNWPIPFRTRRVSLFQSFASLCGGGAHSLAAWFRRLFVRRFVRSHGWSCSVSSDAGCPCRSLGTRASRPFPAPARLVTPGLAAARRSRAFALAQLCTRRRGSSCRVFPHSAAERLLCRSGFMGHGASPSHSSVGRGRRPTPTASQIPSHQDSREMTDTAAAVVYEYRAEYKHEELNQSAALVSQHIPIKMNQVVTISCKLSWTRRV